MNQQRRDSIPLISEERLKLGLERLLAAPLDLRKCKARVWGIDECGTGSVEHQRLFSSYVRELASVIPEARRVWIAIVEDCRARTGDLEKAVREALTFQPAGPAFDGRVVAVVRKYWLECDLLNTQLEDKVSPQIFLLVWLVESNHRDAVEVLGGMPYWPIGLDKDGNWI